VVGIIPFAGRMQSIFMIASSPYNCRGKCRICIGRNILFEEKISEKWLVYWFRVSIPKSIYEYFSGELIARKPREARISDSLVLNENLEFLSQAFRMNQIFQQ